MIKFSIITVCYNASATIRETIVSVLGQTYPELEYIVVDGKSDDGTTEILQSVTDKRLTFISEKDSGIYNAMNKGLRMNLMKQIKLVLILSCMIMKNLLLHADILKRVKFITLAELPL